VKKETVAVVYNEDDLNVKGENCMRVLLAEDDELLGDAVCKGLIEYFYTVDWVKDGQSAQEAISLNTFDIIVLDIGLPKSTGFEVLKFIRSKNITTPIVILTARDSIDDQIKGLDAGADDYVTKPFDLDALCARLRAMQRRASSRAEPILTYGFISLDPASHTVHANGELMNISRREFTLLQKLLENQGRVLSRESLTSTLYGWGADVDSNALEVHIHNLRKKFGTKLIRTFRGVGYMIDKEDKSAS
jgi:two-component system, OmpR family, response regulator QseB